MEPVAVFSEVPAPSRSHAVPQAVGEHRARLDVESHHWGLKADDGVRRSDDPLLTVSCALNASEDLVHGRSFQTSVLRKHHCSTSFFDAPDTNDPGQNQTRTSCRS